MDSQKLENLLNLALDATPSEREKSLNLSVGYDEADNMWNLIVKYVGSLENIRNIGISAVELLNNYAILTVQESLIDRIATMDEIVFVEKPKRLNFAVLNGRSVSCISGVQEGIEGLYGEGVIIAVIDSGIDYANNVFRNSDGTTRIIGLWDQTAVPEEGRLPPEGYDIGVYYDSEDINEALKYDNRTMQQQVVKSIDTSGHGTAVAAIAAGNFSQDKSIYLGIAPKSNILAVKLGLPLENSFPRTSELMQALDFCVRTSMKLNTPIVINLSFGNTYGSHDGTSLIETYIDQVSGVGVNTIVAGTGNEGAVAGHTSGYVENQRNTMVELVIERYEPTINLQIWKYYVDIFDIEVITPSGRSILVSGRTAGSYRYGTDLTELLVYYGEPSPFSQYQEIYIDFIPRETYITEGIWQIKIYGRRVVYGRYDMWLPAGANLNGSRFTRPTPDTTLTIPSTARKIISVGAYNGYNNSYADFSGRGFDRTGGIVKPDIVAPGVDITTAAAGGGTITASGTSFATPFVSGSAALLMEWGIVRGNDMYLYGEKIKAYMIRGAKQLPGEVSPSEKTGWGALCLADSFP